MDKDLNVLTKKYWLRFVVTALTNAAIFTTYRLYINHLNKINKEKNDLDKNEVDSPKIKLMNTELDIKENIDTKEQINKFKNTVSPKVKSSSKPKVLKSNENKENKEIKKDNSDSKNIPRKTGRPKKENKPIIKHLQKH